MQAYWKPDSMIENHWHLETSLGILYTLNGDDLSYCLTGSDRWIKIGFLNPNAKTLRECKQTIQNVAIRILIDQILAIARIR